MVTTPNIYDDDESLVSNDLTPVKRRKANWLNFLKSVLTPQQWLNDLVFTKYYGGSNASMWVSGSSYNYGDNVKYLDNAIYESINLNSFTSTTAPNLDSANWIKVLDTFVGVAERVRYTGQQIMLEYLLNKYFNVGAVGLPFTGASHTTQIFISRNIVNNNNFWMSTLPEGMPEAYMPIDSSFATSWMPITTSATQIYSFTINVPSAVATSINSQITTVIPGSSDTYVTLITSIVNNYVRAGKQFNVTTY